MTERFTTNPREAVIIFEEPGLGRRVQAGKFCHVKVKTKVGVRAYWAYVNDVSVQMDLHQEMDAWGIAPCVLDMMGRMGIDQIHFCCKDEGVTYIADVGDVKRWGILKRFEGRGAHWHLPRRFWRRVTGFVKYPWVERKLELRWLEPEVA